jgi:hypothetical protein
MKRAKPNPSRDKAPREGVGKRVTFDAATWAALDLYARDSMKSFQELADEAFADLLKKHERPTSLKEALRASTRRIGANDNPRRHRGR